MSQMTNQCLRFLFVVILLGYGQSSWSAPSTACKGLSFELQTALIDLNLDPAPPLQMTVTRTGNGTCEFFLVIDGPSTSRFLTHGGDTYPIQMYTNPGHTNVWMSLTEGPTAVNVISGNFSGNNSSIFLTYYPRFVPNASKPNGPYTGGFSITLYQDGLSYYDPAQSPQSKNVNFKYTQEPFIDIALVDTGAPFVVGDRNQALNFGNLVTGAMLGCDVILQHNAGYRLSMSSANGGQLKNTNGALTSFNLVPYSLTLNGSPITLTSLPQEVNSSTNLQSPEAGTRLPVSVTIGNLIVAKPLPGTYSDVVTISVSAY